MYNKKIVNFQAIESAERERRGALLKKNQEREGKIFAKKKALTNQTYFAFGSCTPRMGYSISGNMLKLAFSSPCFSLLGYSKW